MAKFLLTGVNNVGDQKQFWYDNMTSELTHEDGSPVEVHRASNMKFPDTEAVVVTRDQPGSKGDIRVLKIQLGLSCNYECTYCSQRFVPRADETNKDDVEPFIQQLDSWIKEEPQVIEFWGGEPLVYIKTLKPLAEKLREKYPNAHFNMITNGSLLNPELNEWLDKMGFGIGISHDGPGQHVRGPDPLDDPKSREGIMDLYRRLKPQGRISFNTMMHAENMDRYEVTKFFVELTGDPYVNIGEGAFVDPYDDDAMQQSLRSRGEHLYMRRVALQNIRNMEAMNFDVVRSRMQEWINSVALKRQAKSLGQKCGMDTPDKIAVDLKGNVLTCQNVSSVATSMNGESHKIGHVSDLAAVKLNTATHWSHRNECPTCPVLQACKGACMFLEGKNWIQACDNAYSDHIPFFAAAIEAMTGYLPIRVEHESLAEDRKNIFGGLNEEAKPRAKSKFPIPVVAI